MVSINLPNELEETAPLRLQDQPQSELANLVKVRCGSTNSPHFPMLTPLQSLQLEASKLRAELRTVNTTRMVAAPAEEPADPLTEH